MTQRPLVFVHGWGFDSNFWQPVAECLPDFARVFVEFGFHGGVVNQPKMPGAVVIAHSMGFAWALANIPRPWAGAIAVNGFARFTRAPDFVSGVAPRMVERMLSRFQSEPDKVTADFLRRCGLADPVVTDLETKPLGDALEWLSNCDQRGALGRLDCPLLALAGTSDAIVSEPMSRESFAGHPLILAQGSGHLLPLSNPEWVAGQIRDFVNGLQ